MKRCPECRRDYYDDTLLYCLDDGNALLEGPARSDRAASSGGQFDEPQTAILHETASPSEAATRAQIHTTEQTAVLPSGVADVSKRKGFDKRLLLAPLALAVIVLGGFFGYRYFYTSSGQISSIAVLPFTNATGDKENDYLADGLAETLINNFTKIRDLKVIARSTAFSFRGRENDPQGIGRELDVGSVLTGRLMQRGDGLSIQVDLINTSNGAQFWGNRYEGTTAALVNIQQRIATVVSSQLKLKLSGSQQQQIAKTYTENSEAYQHYLRGRFLWNKRTGDDLKKALQEFQAAVDLDPSYALAYVGLADSFVLLDEYAATGSAETLPKARAYAERARELDPSLGEAYATVGLMERYSWNWDESEGAYARSIELNPNYPTVYHWRSIGLRDSGNGDLGLADIKRAQELDPLSGIITVNRGLIHVARGETDQGIDVLKKTIELNPSWWGTHNWLGIAYLTVGRNDDAVKTLERAVELNRSHTTLSNLAYAYAITGQQERARDLLKELEAKYASGQRVAFQIAVVDAGLGDKDAALTWLERSFADRNTLLPSMRWPVMFKSLHGEPRFKEILRKMNLPA